MRSLLSLAAAVGLMVTGCQKSPEGGSPGTANHFTITAPTLTTTIKQNNKESVKLTINRGNDFKQTVALAATAPAKIHAEFSKTKVAPSDPTDVTLTVTVDKDAPVGDQVIKVTGTPEKGEATSVDVKIHVDANP